LELEVLIWRHLKHPNVSEFYGLAFGLGYMPALILLFYGNGTIINYVKEKNNATRLDMVFCVRFLDNGLSDEALSR
jgi:hypothetical protein